MKYLSPDFVRGAGIALIGCAASLGGLAVVRGADGKIGYNQYIRPILSENCFYCHGPDQNRRKAELRLDDRDTAVGKGAIVPGKPDESELVSRIVSGDADERMPPPATHKLLTDRQKDLLKAWIAQGAKYETHWAYIAPARPAAAAVQHGSWGKNAIDAFLLAALESKNLTPAKEADKRTLLRRLSLDLTGLPPTPEELDAFLSDSSADAYEKQVDRLMASPHYGERMAVPWLDAVRFADTVGFHGDQNQNVFPYRDYVIDAFNKNKPFDQFTIEQLAGDLLPSPTPEQLTATCFNRLTMMTREGGAQAKEYLAKYQADRVRTVAGAWLGSTMGCCECHDHKYDPFKAKDFYSLSAYWADVKQWGIYADYGYSPNPEFKGYNNDSPFPPEAKVSNAHLLQRMEKCRRQIDALVGQTSAKMAQDSSQRKAFDQWTAQTQAFLKRHPTGWETLAMGEMSTETTAAPPRKAKKNARPAKAARDAKPKSKSPGRNLATFSLVPGPAPSVEQVAHDSPPAPKCWESRPDGSILLTGKPGQSEKLEFPLHAGAIAAIRLEALPSEQNAGSILRGAAARTTVELSAALEGDSQSAAEKIAFFHADADFKDDRYDNGRAALGILDGWITASDRVKSVQQAIWSLAKPVSTRDGDRLVITLPRNILACVRISVSPLVSLKAVDPSVGVSLYQAMQNRAGGSGSIDPLVARTYLMSTGWDAAALAEVRKVQRDYLACAEGITPVLVTQAWSPKVTRILPRGNWQDESGEIVQPRPPAFLPQLKGLEGKRQTRLDLAKWLVAAENPLTSRAVVNRLWKQFFGNGLSGTVEDLGAQGEWPSHPELLDWLAVEFREKGWDLKHMVRLIVTSATYRQDSSLRADLKDIDPNNRLLATQNPRRLEAEFVRDNALSIAGLLNLEIGGPSCRPYQPAGYYANIQFPNRDYLPNSDDQQYRRGLYMHWQRTFLHPMLANFDAPSREDGVCTRVMSNTPQQALTLLNDPEFVEAAKALAVRVIGHDREDDARLNFIYQRALARPIKPKEAESLKKFLASQRSYFTANPADAARLLKVGSTQVPAGGDPRELAAWTSLCRVVLNLHETITRY